MAPMQPGGVVPGPRFQREHVETERTIEDRLRERTIVGFSAGVVVGVGWMLLVVFLSDRLL